MKQFMFKFFFFMREWFANAADHIQLFFLEKEIKELKGEITDDIKEAESVWDLLVERHEISVELGMHYTAYCRILRRIREREGAVRQKHALVG